MTELQVEQKAEPVYAEGSEESIIEIVRAGKPRKTKVLKVPIVFEDKDEFVVIKKLSYGERIEFVDKFLKVEFVGEIPKTNYDSRTMQIQSLLMCLHTAPFPITEDYIVNELEGTTAELLFKQCDAFNKLNSKQKKNSNGPLSIQQPTSE